MATLAPEISSKISNLLKMTGKVNDQVLADAKKKFESNGKQPLGMLHYLVHDKKVSEDDIVAVISRNYALRKIQLTEILVKKEALKKNPKRLYYSK